MLGKLIREWMYPLFFIWALDGGKWSASLLGRFTTLPSGKSPPGTVGKENVKVK
jgi:hypothetical protein